MRLHVLLAASVLASTAIVPGTSAQASSTSDDLSATLLSSMRAAHFDQLIDYGPEGDACPDASNPACVFPAPQIAAMPNVDIAVLELDEDGRVDEAANVIMSQDVPNGLRVRIDEKSLSARNVQFRAWNIDRWNGDLPWSGQNTEVALNTPKDRRVTDFMAPYSASLFKVMVAWRVMRLVDAGKLSLDDVVSSAPLPLPGLCRPGGSAPVRDWMDAMITFSSNDATCVVLYKLHQMGEVSAMNAEFADLGLTTLQINGTDPATGGSWNPGQIHMTALDTAKLLLLINGGKGTLWRTPAGAKVTAGLLSESSRSYLKGLLADQGFHEVLSTGNFCGAPYAEPGIPAVVPSRWIDPVDGSVTVDGIPYFQDVRPCNAAAEVTFAHKTGLTWNYGSDGGIVESLPGAPGRRYIIVMLSNLGYRYNDPQYADATVNPCFDPGVCYSQQFPVIARTVDTALRD